MVPKNVVIFTAMKFIVVLWLTLLQGSAQGPLKVGHEFYVSTTELRVDAQQGRLTGVMQVFPDDWERAMNALLQREDKRYQKLSELQKDSLHAAELVRTFKVKASETLALDYVGSETSKEYVRLYFTLGEFGEDPVDVWMLNVWTLADIFPSQENIITFYHADGSRETNSCREGNEYLITL